MPQRGKSHGPIVGPGEKGKRGTTTKPWSAAPSVGKDRKEENPFFTDGK